MLFFMDVSLGTRLVNPSTGDYPCQVTEQVMVPPFRHTHSNTYIDYVSCGRVTRHKPCDTFDQRLSLHCIYAMLVDLSLRTTLSNSQINIYIKLAVS